MRTRFSGIDARRHKVITQRKLILTGCTDMAESHRKAIAEENTQQENWLHKKRLWLNKLSSFDKCVFRLVSRTNLRSCASVFRDCISNQFDSHNAQQTPNANKDSGSNTVSGSQRWQNKQGKIGAGSRRLCTPRATDLVSQRLLGDFYTQVINASSSVAQRHSKGRGRVSEGLLEVWKRHVTSLLREKLRYCSRTDGWMLNRDVARLFIIVNQP